MCVCLFVCSLCTPRSFDGSSPNLVGVCRLTSHLPLRGSFSKRSTGRRINGSLSLSTILCMRQPHATRCNGAVCFGKQQSLILRLLLHILHLNNVYRWTSGLVTSKRTQGLFLKQFFHYSLVLKISYGRLSITIFVKNIYRLEIYRCERVLGSTSTEKRIKLTKASDHTTSTCQ